MANHSGRLNTEIVVSKLTQGMAQYLRLFCVCVGSGLATLIPRPRSPVDCVRD
jgi:hypothetical protein